MPWVRFAIAKKGKENSRRKFLWQDLPESEKRIVGRTVEMVRTQGVGGWEKTAPSGASAAAMGVDGVSFREKLDRETHRSRNLKCAAGRHPPFQLRLLYIPPSAVTPTTCSRVSIL